MPTESTVRVIPLGELLHQYHLGLVLIAGADDRTGERAVQWVHVSEIEDPAPFLTPDTVLLTTGARFSAIRRQSDADAYIGRLIDARVAALGVGVGLHLDRVPPRIVSACDRLGLPLFRVPYDTPFIAIVQASVRLLEARDRERDLWALDAQRAVSNASLHPTGLSAVLAETAARLGRPVGVTDRTGRIIEFAPAAERADAPAQLLRTEVQRMLDRGVSAVRIGARSGGLQLQALGRPVRGVLVVEEAGPPDAAERNLLALVAALATMHLERRVGADAEQAALREAVVELLLGHEYALAERLVAGARTALPSGDAVVVRHRDRERLPFELVDELRELEGAASGVFAATLHGAAVIIAEARQAEALRRRFRTHHEAAGLSERAPLEQLELMLDQAERAFEHATAEAIDAPTDYSPELHPGVIRLLHENPEAPRRAAGLLEPLRRHDEKQSDAIEASLRVWLAHHGQTSPAALELGVHRHTLTARMRTAAELLRMDLDSPDARAELWAALRLLAPPT